MNTTPNRRILVIDDNASIHADYRKILGATPANAPAHSEARAAFFGEPAAAPESLEPGFELDNAYQGEEGLARVSAALAEKRPYAVAFVDVRMPPGIDGVETAGRIWQIDPEVQVVICTAFADYTWEDLSRRLGRRDRLLILKKPFDPIEVVQLATALTEKWNSAQRERLNMTELRRAEREAQAYAASLATYNRALVTAKASAEASSTAKTDFIGRLAAILEQSSAELLAALERGCEPGQDAQTRAASLEAASARCAEIANTARNLSWQAGLDDGSLVPEPTRYAPGVLLDALAARWRPRAESRGLRLVSECRGVLPLELCGDRGLLEGILDALLENALRFTVTGSVRLEAHMPLTEEGDEPRIVYSVIDSGPGIPAEEQPRAFEALQRGPGSGGAHFSLHVLRRLARFLGGELELESAAGAGSTFRLALPAGDLAGVEFGLHPPGPLPSAGNALRSEEARP